LSAVDSYIDVQTLLVVDSYINVQTLLVVDSYIDVQTLLVVDSYIDVQTLLVVDSYIDVHTLLVVDSYIDVHTLSAVDSYFDVQTLSAVDSYIWIQGQSVSYLFNCLRYFLLLCNSKAANPFLDFLPLNMGSIGCPETSVRNCHCSLRNAPEERSCRLRRGGSLKSRFHRSVPVESSRHN